MLRKFSTSEKTTEETCNARMLVDRENEVLVKIGLTEGSVVLRCLRHGAESRLGKSANDVVIDLSREGLHVDDRDCGNYSDGCLIGSLDRRLPTASKLCANRAVWVSLEVQVSVRRNS
jgi:hypothetical protein